MIPNIDLSTIPSSLTYPKGKGSHRFRNLLGQRYGRLLVIQFAGMQEKSRWLCTCRCGNFLIAQSSNLFTGNTTSCGCRQKEVAAKLLTTHGLKQTPEYNAYCGAKARCTNPKEDSWQYYGGRGIQFRFTSFEQFIAHIGTKPSALHTLDRIDNEGHYEIGNVKWSTPKEQASNRRPRKDSINKEKK